MAGVSLPAKFLRRKFTGECDMFILDGTFNNGHIGGQACGEPARFYNRKEIGMWGAYLCDEHAIQHLEAERLRTVGKD